MTKIYSRNCPKCGIEITYTFPSGYYRAKKLNRHCRSCGNKMKPASAYLHLKNRPPHTEETKIKISNSLKNHEISDETRLKISKSTIERQKTTDYKENRRKGIQKFLNDSVRYNKFITNLSKSTKDFFTTDAGNETKRKMRISAIKRIEKNTLDGNQLHPNFNSDACKMIDEYGEKNGYKFQHAMNGGEHHIKELGYFIDGYDKEKNVVIEYNEKHHKYGKSKIKTLNRKMEIMNFLKCEFIELEE